jgi:hypothetical protein
MNRADLIDRLEKLTGPVLDSFERIRLARMAPDIINDLDSLNLFELALRGGLEAIGAAVALVERLGWRLYGLGRSPVHGLWWAQVFSIERNLAAECEEIDTGPVAVLLALFRALEAEGARDE